MTSTRRSAGNWTVGPGEQFVLWNDSSVTCTFRQHRLETGAYFATCVYRVTDSMGVDSSSGTDDTDAVTKLTDDQRRQGMRSITGMALSGQVVGTLTGGAFIVAVLVAYDAPLYVYGLLAALPSLAGVLQVPAAYLVERYRKRKLIAFGAFGGMRLVGLVFVLVPLLAAPEVGTVLILGAVFAKSLAGAVSGPAWNSMVRDIVPTEGMGGFFARRQRLTVALGIPLSLGAGWFVTRRTTTA